MLNQLSLRGIQSLRVFVFMLSMHVLILTFCPDDTALESEDIVFDGFPPLSGHSFMVLLPWYSQVTTMGIPFLVK